MVSAQHPRTLRTIPFLIAVGRSDRNATIKAWLFRSMVVLLLNLVAFPAYAKYSGGSGTAQDPYRIAKAPDLAELGGLLGRADCDKHFLLVADVNLSDRVWQGPVIPEFSGTFDGNDLSVHNLTIADNYSNLGLFGLIKAGAVIKNLGVIDVRVTGSGSYVGALAGQNAGSVVNCHSTVLGPVSGNVSVGGLIGENSGTVSECHSDSTIIGVGHGCVGGLIGRNYGSVTHCYASGGVSSSVGFSGGLIASNLGSVTHCYASGGVNGGGDGVGGLVGSNTGSVVCCWSSGQVGGNKLVGGLVGQNDFFGSVINCRSTGAATGRSSVGGLVGTNGIGRLTNCCSTGKVTCSNLGGGLVGDNGNGSIANCYSTGAVIGDANVGGLTGRKGDSGDVSSSFWDMQTSGLASSAGGTGLSTTQMQNIQTYLAAGWDFTGEFKSGTSEIWEIPDGGGYPALSVFNGDHLPQLRGQGTADDPYLIATPMELGAVLYNPGAHYRLVASVDLSSIRWSTAVIPAFSGTFDGNDLTVRNLTVKGAGHLGLFGYLRTGASVRNLGVVDVNIIGSWNCVGGLAGETQESDITRCYATGAVGGTGHYVGGLVGDLGRTGTAADCHSACTVLGEDWGAGGLAGASDYASRVTNCHSTGAVSGNHWVGGLVGWNNGTVENSGSTGMVTGTKYDVGGLVGLNDGSVSKCRSTGSVTGQSWVGGLIGDDWGSVDNCYSSGAVTGNFWIGGLVGQVSGDDVMMCYSNGKVTGSKYDVGGLVGLDAFVYVKKSFWDVQTSGLASSDGGTGLSTAQMKSIKTFLDAGWDFVEETANGTDDIWWINEGKDYPHLWWEREIPAFAAMTSPPDP